MSQMHVLLTNDIDKKNCAFFAFSNSFLKIELNCDKENHVILNKRSFQKKILPT